MQQLLKIKGAWPYVAILFLNAFVDLGHKITVQNTIFKVYDGQAQIILTAIVNGLILLPFIVLFSPSGWIADKFAKDHIMRAAAWFAVAITGAITLCYYQGWFWAAFLLTLALAMQSAIYSPAKYGYIKSLFGKAHLAQANGLVQAVTIVAILLGTFVFSIGFEHFFQASLSHPEQVLKAIAPIGWLLIANSVLELVLAYRLPHFAPAPTTECFSAKGYFTGRSAALSIRPLLSNDVIRLSAIGLAIFWSVGQVLLATFPAYIKSAMAVDNTIVIQGLLAATGIGIALGSSLAGRVSKGYIEIGLVPVAAMGIAASLLLLPTIDSLAGHAANLLFVGVMGGLFIVPLNALIQFNAKSGDLGKIIAGSNFVQNLCMLAFLVLTAGFAYYGISSKTLLNITAVVALAGGIYTIIKLPQSLIRIVLTGILTRRYRVQVQGLENMPEQGGVLLLGNHISWVDWAIVQIASPRPVRFVMLKSIYQRWYLQWLFDLFGVIPIEPGKGSQQSLAEVAESLNNGEVVCLFPEGAISRNGHLGLFRKGFERACSQVNDDVVIVPFYLRGLWGSQFSRSSTRLKAIRSSGMYRNLIVAFGQPLAKDTNADTIKQRVFDLSVTSWQAHAKELNTLPNAWIETVKRVGSEMAIADTLGSTLSASQALTGAISLSKRVSKNSEEQNVGILLPTSAGGVLANMAALLSGKTVVNINFTASQTAIASAIDQAEIKTVYTAKRFVEKLARKGCDLTEVLATVNVVYLEDLKQEITKFEAITTWLKVKCFPAKALQALFCKAQDANSTAAILFSSGSEGEPKGVMLSHQNIHANLKQTSDVLNTEANDVVMASLPLFHAFGLTVTQFMPLIEGMPMVCHADPTDALAVAKAIGKYRATILCGTSTFLRLYTKSAKVHPLMLESLRTVVAGAERLNPEVRDAFQLKFNKPIFEGYGSTETTPVASVNLPDALDPSHWQVQQGSKAGTVGMPLPGTSFKIVDPETFAELEPGEDGMILIGGVQVMQGYLNNAEKTESVIRTINGTRWYVTGDKGHLDRDGFLTIVDRYSRFAKLGGEMISLSSVEDSIRKAANASELDLVAINLPDEKKGEKIAVLVAGILDTDQIKKAMLAAGNNPLMIPSQWIPVDAIPKLGSGKTDFTQARNMAVEGL